MFLFVSLSKSKFFTRVTLVSFVQHSCCTRVVHVALVSHLCCLCLTCVSSVALVLYSCCSCRTRVARVWHSCRKLDQIFPDSFFHVSLKENIINTMDNIIDIKGYGDIMKFFLVTGLVIRFLKNLFRKTKGNNLNLKLC